MSREIHDANPPRLGTPTGIWHDVAANAWKCSVHGKLDIDETNPFQPRGVITCAKCLEEQARVEMLNKLTKPLTDKWHRDFLDLAAFWAQKKSKDPSTKVGAVIVSPDRKQTVMGWNGFPRGVSDLPERYNDRAEKYKRVVHAEANAIVNAKRDLDGWSLYIWPLLPCSGADSGHNCAGLVIQAGISDVYCPAETYDEPRWRNSCNASLEMFVEAGVNVHLLKKETTT